MTKGQQLRKQIDLAFAGLNDCDRERIAKIGFRAWFDETCVAQQKRFKEKKSGPSKVTSKG